MARRLANWLDAYLEWTAESEAPAKFHTWVGLWVLASTLRRRVYLDQGIYKLYPNQYVVLVSPPGLGKTTTLGLGKQILRKVKGVRWAPDSITKEQFTRLLAASRDQDGSCALTICSGELSSLLQPSGLSMVQLLTDLYDGRYEAGEGGWSYATKHQGSDQISDPILNLLACATPSWIAESFPPSVVYHGFTSRCVFIYAEKPRHLTPFPSRPDRRLEEALVSDLQRVAELSGRYDLSPEARDLYVEYYEALESQIPDYRVEAFHYRKRVHVLKVALLRRAGQGDSRQVERSDLEWAIGILHDATRDMAKSFALLGKHPQIAELEAISRFIRGAGEVTEVDLFRQFGHVGRTDDLADIIRLLHRSGRVEIDRDPRGRVKIRWRDGG